MKNQVLHRSSMTNRNQRPKICLYITEARLNDPPRRDSITPKTRFNYTQDAIYDPKTRFMIPKTQCMTPKTRLNDPQDAIK